MYIQGLNILEQEPGPGLEGLGLGIKSVHLGGGGKFLEHRAHVDCIWSLLFPRNIFLNHLVVI